MGGGGQQNNVHGQKCSLQAVHRKIDSDCQVDFHKSMHFPLLIANTWVCSVRLHKKFPFLKDFYLIMSLKESPSSFSLWDANLKIKISVEVFKNCSSLKGKSTLASNIH